MVSSRPRGMSAPAGDRDFEFIDRTHDRPGGDGELSDGQVRAVVHAVDFDARPAGEQAVVDHRPRPGSTFFGGLEYDDHRTVEGTALGEVPRGAQQHRRVTVVTAGVHLALAPARPRACPSASSIGRASISARSPIVRPEPLVCAADHADDTGAPDPLDDLVDAGWRSASATSPAVRGHVVQQLGVLVQVAAEAGQALRLSCATQFSTAMRQASFFMR